MSPASISDSLISKSSAQGKDAMDTQLDQSRSAEVVDIARYRTQKREKLRANTRRTHHFADLMTTVQRSIIALFGRVDLARLSRDYEVAPLDIVAAVEVDTRQRVSRLESDVRELRAAVRQVA